MTVHGAKGLEAPIVILPDTARRPFNSSDALLKANDLILWKPIKEKTPQALSAFNEQKRQKELQERDRLLYVAMTRAEKWLIVAAAGDLGGEHPSWYEQVADGMERAGAYDQIFENGIGKRVSFGNWERLPPKAPDVSEDQLILPSWYAEKPKPPAEEEYIVTPSVWGSQSA